MAVLLILVVQGTGVFVRFFTVPSLKAPSGKKYTPTGAVKRYFEKHREEKGQE